MPEMEKLHPTAKRHQRVRRQHSDELAEDYVEAIYSLLQEGDGPVRVTDLQTVFGVSHVSVIRALQRLEKRELVDRSGAEGLQLTDAGIQMAEVAAERHDLVERFLLALGVSEPRAKADAEGIEHHLSDESLGAMRRFVDGDA